MFCFLLFNFKNLEKKKKKRYFFTELSLRVVTSPKKFFLPKIFFFQLILPFLFSFVLFPVVLFSFLLCMAGSDDGALSGMRQRGKIGRKSLRAQW